MFANVPFRSHALFHTRGEGRALLRCASQADLPGRGRPAKALGDLGYGKG
jgi:hypothetical protein